MTPKSTKSLPQLSSSKLFLTEGGIETTLVYEKHIDLPCFAAFPLLDTAEGKQTLMECYRSYVNVALKHKTGIVMETQTWRASSAWASQIGLSVDKVMELNRKAVKALVEIRNEMETPTTPIVISGNIGPLSDAYKDSSVSREQARQTYHGQVAVLVDAGIEMLSIATITNVDEGIAAAEVAREFDIPVLISFTVERDGRLLGGGSLEEAIAEVDRATGGYTTYFGINCVHPTHVLAVLNSMSPGCRDRIGSIRGNASSKSHDELDNSETLDRGDIPVYANDFQALAKLLPNLKVVGGCCGTDEEHIDNIAERLVV